MSVSQQQVLQAQNHDLREQVGSVQQKLDRSSAENRELRAQVLGLQTQTHNLDAQLMALRVKEGVSAPLDEPISVEVRTGVGAEATVEKGARHGAEEGR